MRPSELGGLPSGLEHFLVRADEIAGGDEFVAGDERLGVKVLDGSGFVFLFCEVAVEAEVGVRGETVDAVEGEDAHRSGGRRRKRLRVDFAHVKHDVAEAHVVFDEVATICSASFVGEVKAARA